VFGPEIMPYIGIELPDDLVRLISDWEYLPEEIKDNITEIAKKNVIQKNENFVMVAA
jgi:hypothetical protein